ncbi:hypothetical protein Tco_1012252 [Tanacetum coccineum]
MDDQNELNRLQEMLNLRNLNQDPPVDLYDLKGSDKGVNEIDSLTKELSDTFLMGDDVISTIPERKNDEFIKYSVDNLVPIPRESELTLGSTYLECSIPIDPPLLCTDVLGDVIVDIDLLLGEHLDTLSTGDREIDFNPSRDIEELERLLADDAVPIPRVFDEPLGDDTKPISYDFGPPESTLVIDESSLLVTPLPDPEQIYLREMERFDPFFSPTDLLKGNGTATGFEVLLRALADLKGILLCPWQFLSISLIRSQASVRDSFSCWEKARISPRSQSKRGGVKNQLMKGVRSSSHISIVPSFSSSNHVFVSAVSDRGNIIRQLHSWYGDCRTGSQSENTVGSPYGFIIYGIEILKDNEKVMEVIDVENWCIDNSRLLRWIVSLFKRNSSVSSTKSSIQSTL